VFSFGIIVGLELEPATRLDVDDKISFSRRH